MTQYRVGLKSLNDQLFENFKRNPKPGAMLALALSQAALIRLGDVELGVIQLDRDSPGFMLRNGSELYALYGDGAQKVCQALSQCGENSRADALLASWYRINVIPVVRAIQQRMNRNINATMLSKTNKRS